MLNRILKTICAVMLMAAVVTTAVISLGANAAHTDQEPLKIELVVDAQGIYSVFYTAYLDGRRACSGGAADLDGNEIVEGRVLEYVIMPSLLGDEADLTTFSIDFSPYDSDSLYELGRTNAVAFPAEYGMTYRIHLIEIEDGYDAILERDVGEENTEKFTIEISGAVLREEVDYSYLHVDYFLGEEQLGFLYTCVDEGEDAIRIDFPKEAFEGFMENLDISSFHADLYLSYSEWKSEDAVLQAMYGNPGEDEYLTSIHIAAAYGETYRYKLTGNRQDGYRLEEMIDDEGL